MPQCPSASVSRSLNMQHLHKNAPGLPIDADGQLGAPEGYYHIFAVAQFPQSYTAPDDSVVITPYTSDAGQHKAWRPANPSARRDGLVVLLGSEHGEWLELRIAQHKGNTYVSYGPAALERAPFDDVDPV